MRFGVAEDMMSVAISRDLAQDLRSGNLFSNRGTTVLDAPEPSRARSKGLKRGAAVTEMPLRRDSPYPNDAPDEYELESDYARRPRRSGLRLSIHGGVV